MPPQDTLEKKEEVVPAMRSPEQNSWGALIAIVVIIVVVVVGAFYAWGKRVSETRGIIVPTESADASSSEATTTSN